VFFPSGRGRWPCPGGRVPQCWWLQKLFSEYHDAAFYFFCAGDLILLLNFDWVGWYGHCSFLMVEMP
jgi:hypothetical protein